MDQIEFDYSDPFAIKVSLGKRVVGVICCVCGGWQYRPKKSVYRSQIYSTLAECQDDLISLGVKE